MCNLVVDSMCCKCKGSCTRIMAYSRLVRTLLQTANAFMPGELIRASNTHMRLHSRSTRMSAALIPGEGNRQSTSRPTHCASSCTISPSPCCPRYARSKGRAPSWGTSTQSATAGDVHPGPSAKTYKSLCTMQPSVVPGTPTARTATPAAQLQRRPAAQGTALGPAHGIQPASLTSSRAAMRAQFS